MGNANGRTESDHDFHLVVQSRLRDGTHEENTAAERVAEISGQFVLFGDVENVIDAGRSIVTTHFVPSESIEESC